MKVIQNKIEGVFEFIATDIEETKVLRKLIKACKPGNKLNYGGYIDNPDNSRSLNFHFGAKKKIQRKRISAYATLKIIVPVGGIQLSLAGNDKEDLDNIRTLRDICRLGSDEVIFLSGTEIDGLVSIVIAPSNCKVCGAKIADLVSSEFNICETCAGNCEHEYEEIYVRGVGFRDFCGLCGRMKGA